MASNSAARKVVSSRSQLDHFVQSLGEASKKISKLASVMEAVQSAALDLDGVIGHLNSIRSGKSLKDDEVLAQLKEYYGKLKDGEKQALDAFLKGIAQIVTGQVQAAQASDMESAGVQIVATGKKVRTVKPNVIRKPSVVAAATSMAPKEAPKEDTTAPTPIVPKKR